MPSYGKKDGAEEFGDAIDEHNKKTGVTQDTGSGVVCLLTGAYMGIFVPAYLFTSDLFALQLDDAANLPYFVAVPLITTILLKMGYTSASVRTAALLKKGSAKGSAGDTAKEALYWSLFTNNVSYLVLFLLFAFNVTQKIGLTGEDQVKNAYAVSAVVPALLIMAFRKGWIIKL